MRNSAVPSAHGTKKSLSSGIGVSITTLVESFLYASPDKRASCALYDTVIQEVEGAMFEAVLKFADYNQIQAAKILGIHRNTLRRKLDFYGLLPA